MGALQDRLKTTRIGQVRNAEKSKQDFYVFEDDFMQLREIIHSKVLACCSRNNDDSIVHRPAELMALIHKVIDEEQIDRKISQKEFMDLAQDVFDGIVGFGPLEYLLKDKSISEVMINGKDKIFVERHGNIVRVDMEFRSDEQILNIINRIVTKVGRRCDEANPMVDARLPDGSRVNAVIPPIAIDGPCITIRKFPDKALVIADLVEFGSLNYQMASFLEAAVKARCSILVSGGTGSGKTTLLNVLSSFISNDERIVTIEDAAELNMQQDHVIRLEVRQENSEGAGLVSTRDLVRNSLRMRPDRIVVGEVRGEEALDMLQALNTGHAGSMTTLHANSARDALNRLETMVLMGGVELPSKAIREQVVSAIDLIVHQERLPNGLRRVMSITEVVGLEGNDRIIMQDIFRYDLNSKKHTASQMVPGVIKKIEEQGGGTINENWFK